jgi:hypothetical protein
MSHINFGTRLTNGVAILTKKALKAHMTANPEKVEFYSTEWLGANAGKVFTGDSLPRGDKLSVVGPDPERSRKWYGTVESNGKVT